MGIFKLSIDAFKSQTQAQSLRKKEDMHFPAAIKTFTRSLRGLERMNY